MFDGGEESACVILENGSSQIKAGFAYEDSPRTIFPSRVGVTKKSQQVVQRIGFAANEQTMDLFYPIEYGRIKNWEQMEKVITLHMILTSILITIWGRSGSILFWKNFV